MGSSLLVQEIRINAHIYGVMTLFTCLQSYRQSVRQKNHEEVMMTMTMTMDDDIAYEHAPNRKFQPFGLIWYVLL